MTAGTFLVGAFDRAAQLWDRMDATVEVGLTDNQFVKNMVSILAEERLALCIYQAGALVGGAFAVS
jgi:HK97 family phage major capsid protein